MNALAMIVAASENDVIGVDGDLPWHLSADLRRFKRLTIGHHIIMGRKTFDSIGRLLPGRTTVILTRQEDYQVAGAKIVHSIEGMQEIVKNDELPFVTGGAEIYSLLLPLVTDLYLTRVHVEIDGDTRLPALDWHQWTLVDSEKLDRDDQNDFDYSFELYRRQ